MTEIPKGWKPGSEPPETGWYWALATPHADDESEPMEVDEDGDWYQREVAGFFKVFAYHPTKLEPPT